MTTQDARNRQRLADEARRRGLPEWQYEMAQAVSDSTLRDIVRDAGRTSPVAFRSVEPTAGGSGWYAPQSLDDWAKARYGGLWAETPEQKKKRLAEEEAQAQRSLSMRRLPLNGGK